MKGKALLAIACAVSLACGYIAGKAGSPFGRENEATPAAQALPDRTRAQQSRARSTGNSALLDSILGGRPIGEIPAAELAALIARLSTYEPDMDSLTRAKQSYQLALVLAKLSADDLVGIATKIKSDPKAKKVDLTSIVSALVAKDPDRAIALLYDCDMPDTAYSKVFGTIAQDDPNAAADILRERFLNGSISQSNYHYANYGIGQAIAKLGADPLLAYIDTLPSNQQSNMVNNVIGSVPKEERIRLLDELSARIEDGRLTTTSLDQDYTVLLASGGKEAEEWFSNLPDGEKKNSLRVSTATFLFNRGEKEAAAEWMREALVATPGKEKQTLKRIVSSLAYNNAEAIPFFAELLPNGQEFNAKDLEDEAVHSFSNGSSGIAAIAAVISDSDEKARFLSGTLQKIASNGHQRLNANDFNDLSSLIATMGFTGENAALVNNALDAARNTKPGAER